MHPWHMGVHHWQVMGLALHLCILAVSVLLSILCALFIIARATKHLLCLVRNIMIEL
jgi:hypothetical protein